MTSLPGLTALGAAAGAGWGVLARVWMRLISEDPEFSWAGTLSIIGLAAVLGAGVGAVHAARRDGRSAWWTLAVVPGLVLFLSPGMLLAPSFVLGGAAFAGRGLVLRVAGWSAIAGPLLAMVLLTFRGPDLPSSVPDLGDLAVSAGGFMLMTLSLAWAGSLVWTRRTTRGTAVTQREAAVVVA